MLKGRKYQSGFTLIELLIVMIIVAILVAVGVSLMSGPVARAKATEAHAGLGTIRTAMRSKFAEAGAAVGYNNVPDGPVTDPDGVGPLTGAGLGLNDPDLLGRYFEADDYTIVRADVTTFCVQVTGDGAAADAGVATLAPKGSEVVGVSFSMNEKGDIFASDNCAGTVTN